MSKEMVLVVHENGKEGKCSCGSVLRLVQVEIYGAGGKEGQDDFPGCLKCFLGDPMLQGRYLTIKGLDSNLVLGVYFSGAALIQENGSLICCNNGGRKPPILPRQLLHVGYLHPCSHCKKVYFMPFDD
jgi:hypothetical protein